MPLNVGKDKNAEHQQLTQRLTVPNGKLNYYAMYDGYDACHTSLHRVDVAVALPLDLGGNSVAVALFFFIHAVA